ncbi:uncharacterized protein LOC126841692 [Adelges cooleyi]|uniref:uncharacterized protein LOC126841692 n=1 Tax=Adelges cooleyi TaxID=133065 RepID=UPI00217F2D01|nr:uncharacterized protein LOC126841692 [Adelges cooleyi]
MAKKKGKKSEPTEKSTVTAPPEKKRNRVDYEEDLVNYNRELAAVRSKCNRLEELRDKHNVEYQTTRQNRLDVLREFAEQIREKQKIINEKEIERDKTLKILEEFKRMFDETMEIRQVKYNKVLEELEANLDFTIGKYKSLSEKNIRRQIFLEKMGQLIIEMEILQQDQETELYTAGRIMATRRLHLRNESNYHLEVMKKTVVKSVTCIIQAPIIQVLPQNRVMKKKLNELKRNWIVANNLLDDMKDDTLKSFAEVAMRQDQKDMLVKMIQSNEKVKEQVEIARYKTKFNLDQSNFCYARQLQYQKKNSDNRVIINKLDQAVREDGDKLTEMKKQIHKMQILKNTTCQRSAEVFKLMTAVAQEIKKRLENRNYNNNLKWLHSMLQSLPIE